MPVATPHNPEYFDYRSVALEAGIADEQLEDIVRIFEVDYPNDLMLRELHVLRACTAVREGRLSLADLLKHVPPSTAA